jgi:hypothetical protein
MSCIRLPRVEQGAGNRRQFCTGARAAAFIKATVNAMSAHGQQKQPPQSQSHQPGRESEMIPKPEFQPRFRGADKLKGKSISADEKPLNGRSCRANMS